MSGSSANSERVVGIRELAESHDLSLRTLRFYEQRGLLSPLRTGTSRAYGPRDKVKLQLICTGKRLGLSLREIEKLILAYKEPEAETHTRPSLLDLMDKSTIESQITELEAQRADIVSALAELHAAMAKLDDRSQE